jgi:hypothetical protein
MKLKFSLFIVLTCFLLSCKKSSSSNSSGNKIEYQVTFTGVSGGNVTYNNEDQQTIGTSANSGWVVSFNTAKKPFTATLRAASATGNTTTVMTLDLKIFVNDKIVQSQSFSGTVALDQQIQYVVQ